MKRVCTECKVDYWWDSRGMSRPRVLLCPPHAEARTRISELEGERDANKAILDAALHSATATLTRYREALEAQEPDTSCQSVLRWEEPACGECAGCLARTVLSTEGPTP